MENQTKNIYEKLLDISSELNNVAKTTELNIGKGAKKAVFGESDVLKAVKPLEEKHRVYSFPVSRKIIESGTVESGDAQSARKQFFERIEVVYRFVNVDKPDEYVDITSYGDGIDPGDKSVGKAMTYADKYALMKAYKIVTGEDPDQYASEDLSSFKKNGLTPAGFKMANDHQINLAGLAAYLKKDASSLTDDDVRYAVDIKARNGKNA